MIDVENSILSKARILLVDSDESVRQSMLSYFRDISLLFATAKSAEEALPLLEGPPWDIVVCNLKLPGINGLEFCKRAWELKPGIKLVLATQYATPSLMKKSAEFGIVETIPAPMTPDYLISSLVNVLWLTESLKKPITRMIGVGFEVSETVSMMELDESMIITAFIRFSGQYREISPETSTWIQHNFAGAQAIVNREGQELELLTDDIKPGDDLVKLYRLPIGLMKLTFVRKQLIRELKERGFLAFEVKRKPTEKTIQQKIRLGAIRRTEEFIGKVIESVSVRENAGDAIKDMFYSFNDEPIDSFDLLGHVEGITEKNTAEAIGAIAALKKGDHLYTHCVDVGAIFLTVYSHWVKGGGIVSPFNNNTEILLSAILHDIGKITTPREISESQVAFNVSGMEMPILREHATDGANILSRLDFSETAINMAHYHHVKMDTSLASSYPTVDSYESVMPETRLLAVVDMFQALVGQRSYKKSWNPSDAMKYINQLVGIECDPIVWVAFREALGWFPVGSLVELNDGSQAFVVEKAYHGLHRPSVVVTRNSFDEELTHNTFLDLNMEKDIFIKKGLNHFHVYGDQAINRFIQLQVS